MMLLKKLLSFFRMKPSPPVDPDRRAREVAYWKEFWPKVQEAALQSEEHVDKKVFALSAGGIGIELTILSLPIIEGLQFLWLAAISAGLFVVALLFNLLVHLRAWSNQSEQSKVISDFIEASPEAKDSKEIYSLLLKHSNRNRRSNYCATAFLISGIVALFVFTFLNLYF